ncbi:pitrilysin family protein [Desulfopila sp. IMCC35008]|uniref:M16 family metallopeptidase n=1 Tax=Desulfopila sp. IMCC35008 TaxID=2653858 RepID=UPI0013D68B8B|nr:M16 family metallopeptidase [Desulfopila sp. IMCC35008]
MNCIFKYLWPSVVGVVLCVAALVGGVQKSWADDTSCISTGWPSDLSDLKPDPLLKRGILANGFRYILLPNNEPEDRVAIYLNIQAGSLHEQENQRGVAHFLEHMLFNGTTHYPPGELIDFFQSIGMNFGGDTNAHTSFDETVYKINLPQGTEKYLRDGMQVMADFGGGALLNEEEIDRERGIILEEKRSRDSASYRTHVESNKFRMRGTLMPERLVIGEEVVLRNANRDLLKQYYDSWYRPENMVLVVVGDFDTSLTEQLVGEYFNNLRSSETTSECPDFGNVQHQGLEPFYHYEPDLGRTEISIQTIWNQLPIADSLAYQAQELHKYAAILMMNNRLERTVESEDTGATDSGYYSGDILGKVGYSVITSRTDGKSWKKALASLSNSLQQALVHGFLQQELDIVKKDLLASLESAVSTAESRTSQELAASIIRSFNGNRVFQSPEQELEQYKDIVLTMDLGEVNDLFRKGWQHSSRIVSVTGDALLDVESPNKMIADYYLELEKIVPSPLVAAPKEVFPYLKVQPGNYLIMEENELPEVGAKRIVLSNNVVLTFKKTDYEPNKVRVVVDIGTGQFAEPRPGMSLVAQEVLNDSGTGTLSRTEFSDVLAGTTINVDFRSGEGSFRYSGQAITKDSELLLQVLHALIRDPAFSKDTYDRSIQRLYHMYDRLEKDINGPLRGDVQRFLAGGDTKAGLPPRDSLKGFSRDDVREWLFQELASSSMEVVLIGDFDYEQMKAAVLPLFSDLGMRLPIEAVTDKRTFPKGENRTFEIDSPIDKSVVIVAWPTTDMMDIERTRRLNLLAQIFKERVRTVIREKLGASYSPSVYSRPSKIYRGYGLFVAQVVTSPQHLESVRNELLTIASDLREHGTTAEELLKVQKPLLTSLKDTIKTNNYWLYSVLGESVRYPQQLQWSTTMQDDYGSVTVQEINQLAKTFLLAGVEAAVEIRPQQITPR